MSKKTPFPSRRCEIREFSVLVLLIFLTALNVVLLLPFSKAQALGTGEIAPDFSAPATNGKTVRLGDFKGSWVVLYFYPKAFTPGCTKESCSLRDGYKDIQKHGAVILGVSLDDMETQKKFKAEYKLPFELLSDQDKTIAKAYDTLAWLGLYAKRKTFLIDPQGKIAHVFEKVDPETHTSEILKKLISLKSLK